MLGAMSEPAIAPAEQFMKHRRVQAGSSFMESIPLPLSVPRALPSSDCLRDRN
jgi:hypothetical protein